MRMRRWDVISRCCVSNMSADCCCLTNEWVVWLCVWKRHNTAQYGITKHDTTKHITAWHGIACYIIAPPKQHVTHHWMRPPRALTRGRPCSSPSSRCRTPSLWSSWWYISWWRHWALEFPWRGRRGRRRTARQAGTQWSARWRSWWRLWRRYRTPAWDSCALLSCHSTWMLTKHKV